MFTPEWHLALICQGGIAVIAILVGKLVLRIPLFTALLAAAIFHSIPVMTAPGFRTPVFVQDLLLPVLAVLVLVRFRNMPRGIAGLAIVAIFLWPIVGTLVSIANGVTGYAWVTYLYRRFGFLLYLLAGACVFPKMKVRDLIDMFTVLWIGMAIVGLMQYFGLLNVDFVLADVGAGAIETGGKQAQRGFLGLHRASVGAFSSAILAYCVAQLLLGRRVDPARVTLYTLAISLSAVVVLFSGSRTGAIACLCGVTYVCLVAFRYLRHVRAGRLMVFGTLGAAVTVYLVAPAATVVQERLEMQAGVSALHVRLEAQKKVLAYAVSHAEAGLLGMGRDNTQFRLFLGTPLYHPHSEYLEILWTSGFTGLLLYLFLLYRLYFGMKPEQRGSPDALCIGVRGMFVAGLVIGLAVGNLLIISERLATYGTFMLFLYGLLYGHCERRAGPLRTLQPHPRALPMQTAS